MDIEFPNLKRQLKKSIENQEAWTKENILDGLKKFYKENGRYPVSFEIDTYEYLPSSKQIQRRFGGLIKLRMDLGLKIVNFGGGTYRSSQATEIGIRGGLTEREIENFLVEQLGEYFVHVEKPLYKFLNSRLDSKYRFKQRADFFIYTKNKPICIDVFFARDIKTLQRIVNIKEKKYSGLSVEVILLNWNNKTDITDESLIKLQNNKKNKLENNILLMNKDTFVEYIKKLEPIVLAK